MIGKDLYEDILYETQDREDRYNRYLDINIEDRGLPKFPVGRKYVREHALKLLRLVLLGQWHTGLHLELDWPTLGKAFETRHCDARKALVDLASEFKKVAKMRAIPLDASQYLTQKFIKFMSKIW